MRILVVEDEPKLNELISSKLELAHYSVDRCLNGLDALDYIRGAEYDLIILDILLPGLDGMTVLRKIRDSRDATPVLMLTAKDAISDRVDGLDAGADDYLGKPFAFEELMARVRAMIRRGSRNVSSIFRVADLTVDCLARRVRRGTVSIMLTGKEFDILEYLIRNSGTVLSREKISRHIWNYDYEGGSNVVDVYIRYLRKKLDDGFSPKLIHTVRGAGYVLRQEEESL